MRAVLALTFGILAGILAGIVAPHVGFAGWAELR